MKINYAVKQIVQPAMQAQYRDKQFTIKHVVGIDASQLRTARIGVRGENDLVWIGRAANYAAKLTSLSDAATWITKAVYDNMHDSAKYDGSGKDMWEARSWTAMNRMTIYRSSYWWPIS